VRLVADPAGARWRLEGRHPSRDRWLSFTGSVVGGEVETVHLDPPESADRYMAWVRFGAGREAVAVARRWDAGRPSWLVGVLPAFPMAASSEVWLLGTGGNRLLATSSLTVECLEPGLDDREFACLALDDGRLLVWSVDPVAGALAPVVSLPFGHVRHALDPDGRIVLLTDAGELSVIDVRGRREARLALGGLEAWPDDVAAARHVVALAVRGATGSVVRLYEAP
jgi:hypothetical protein